MAEVSEVHVRVNGWCHTCGGTGLEAAHENELTLTSSDLATWVAGWVRHLYVDLEQSTGGPLHVVLDDGNVADEFLTERDDRYAFLLDGRFEQYAQAGEDVSTGRKVAIRETCEMILAGLRWLPESERRVAIAAAGVWGPIEHKDRTDRLDQLAALDLTDGEWRFLAESALQARFGWSDRGATDEARVALSRRWLQIAAVLHPAAGQHPAILAGRRTSEDGS